MARKRSSCQQFYSELEVSIIDTAGHNCDYFARSFKTKSWPKYLFIALFEPLELLQDIKEHLTLSITGVNVFKSCFYRAIKEWYNLAKQLY